MSSYGNCAGCTVFPVYYLGRVSIAQPISSLRSHEKKELLLRSCHKVVSDIGVKDVRIILTDLFDSSIDLEYCISDLVEVSEIHVIVNFCVGFDAFTVKDEAFNVVFNHAIPCISTISSLVNNNFGFICYIYKDVAKNERHAYVYAVSTIGLEEQIVTLARDMFQLSSNNNIINSTASPLSVISFKNNLDETIRSARLERSENLNIASFHNLNFLRPSSNQADSTVASVAGSFAKSSREPASSFYKFAQKFRKRAIDGSEYVSNTMLHFELWFHGTCVLYSQDCFQNPGDFFVYKIQGLYILRIYNTAHKVVDIILKDENDGSEVSIS